MKTIILILLTAIFAFTGNTQAPPIGWQNTIGGSYREWLKSIQQTSDGGYIIGGYSESGISGDKTSVDGARDYWVIKLDATGNIIWQNTIGGIADDALTSLQQTIDGGYILGGYSRSGISGDRTESSKGQDDYWLVKLNDAGIIIWQKAIGGGDFDQLSSLQQTADSGYILGGHSWSGISGDKTEANRDTLGYTDDYWIVKLDAAGNISWEKTIGGNDYDKLTSIHQTDDGGYIAGGYSYSEISGDKTEANQDTSGSTDDYWVIKLDATGNIVWQNTIGGGYMDRLAAIRQTPDGGYILGGASQSLISGDKTEDSQGSFDYWVIKLDAVGNIIWQNVIGGSTTDWLESIELTPDGGFILGGYSGSDASSDKSEDSRGQADYWIVKIDSVGNIVWQSTLGGNNQDYLNSLQPTADGGYIVGGESYSGISGDKTEANNDTSTSSMDYWIIKLRPIPNLISGTVFIDLNSDCNLDSSDILFKNYLLKADPWNTYANTDSQGNYIFHVDSGQYTIRPAAVNPYLQLQCPAGGHNIAFTSRDTTSIGNNFGLKPIISCPLMEVNISAPLRLRRCRPVQDHYIVQYSNHGTVIANNVYVSVKIPQDVIVMGSSIPWRLPQTGSVYFFDIGSVGIGECGSFTINVTISCNTILGQTICLLAHIYPDTICRPTPGWDGSSVDVEGICVNNDTVQFRISNIGTGDMQDSLNYYIVEDNVMLRSGKFKLLSGAFISPYELANGSTFRLEAQQSPNHPGKSHPSATVEACGTNATGGVSLGFVTTLPQDDADPFVSITCDEIIGSFDPNDKIVFPKGVGADKIISAETELEYKIRFQNTGNDTAFRVVVRDTLSPFLDLATIELGASSHPYEFRIYDTGILEWTFDNILLPDSFVNEAESHGFIQFRVIQIPNNPEGTVIENSADIYFDFNAPVKTNVEFNTVGDVSEALLTVVENLDVHDNISIYPNPFSSFLIIEIGAEPLSQLQLEIYDIQGRLNSIYLFDNTNKVIIHNLNVSTGIYIYKIIADEEVIGLGKIIRLQ